MDLKLVHWPDPILTKKAEAVTNFDEELKELVTAMFKTMDDEGGIGLAAPQVGISKRLFVTKVDDVSLAFINPEIIDSYGEIAFEEGCLSFPGIKVKVLRKASITIKAQREDGVTFKMGITGLAAVCFQHELDHLDGKTFIDSLPKLTREYVTKRYLREKNGK